MDVIHAGTALDGADLVTAGGRVLAVRAVGTDVADARATAYAAADLVTFPGLQRRTDIAAEPLGRRRGRLPTLSRTSGRLSREFWSSP